jgi:hypothetical protein
VEDSALQEEKPHRKEKLRLPVAAYGKGRTSSDPDRTITAAIARALRNLRNVTVTPMQ